MITNCFGNGPNYRIVFANDKYVIIEDLGGNRYPSVTNCAESVCKELYENNFLIYNNQVLLYVDSMGNMDEILHDGQGKFIGFKCGPRSKETIESNKEKILKCITQQLETS